MESIAAVSVIGTEGATIGETLDQALDRIRQSWRRAISRLNNTGSASPFGSALTARARIPGR